MRGYIAIPSNARMMKCGDKSLHFDTKEKMLKAFGLTEARFDYLLVSGAQAYRGYFFDEEISSRRGSKSNIE